MNFTDFRNLINFPSSRMLQLFLILIIFFRFELFVISTGLKFFFEINNPANGLVEFHNSNDLRFNRYAT